MNPLNSLARAGATLVWTCAVTAAEPILISGSDTQVHLVSKLAEEFMAETAGTEVIVKGGGSSAGVSALLEAQCDIANSSRLMKPGETRLAVERKLYPRRVVIAMDGLSVITHADNPVRELVKSQVGAVYRGDITNWKKLGGPDQPITLYGRKPESGTFAFFREYVVQGDYSGEMQPLDGNDQIVEAILADPSGIGYVGIAYAKGRGGINIIHIAARLGAEYVSPLDPEAVKSGKYPIVRPLYQYTAAKPGEAVRKFLEFELSERGQKLVDDEGFFSITEEYRALNASMGF
jgi:phosphate transport system substrate-binding protein